MMKVMATRAKTSRRIEKPVNSKRIPYKQQEGHKENVKLLVAQGAHQLPRGTRIIIHMPAAHTYASGVTIAIGQSTRWVRWQE